MITNRDQYLNALGNNSSRVILDKASITSVAGRMMSLWRATGTPGQGAIPAAAALCTKALTGAVGFQNQVAPDTSYLGYMFGACTTNAQTLEIHDRIAHMGGLNLTLLTTQTVGMNLETLLVPSGRIGDANFSDIQWWYEVYTAGGATASTATFTVTYDDNTSGTLNALAVGGTVIANSMLSLNGLKPTNKQGNYIKSIDSVILSASTGTAGNVGVTATRPRTMIDFPLANKSEKFKWQELGFPSIENDSCLFFMCPSSTTTTGIFRGGGKIVHG